MSRPQASLLTLLDFATKRMPEPARDEFKTQLKTDRTLATKLAKLKETYGRLRGGDPMPILTEAEDQQIPDAESIAAFVEGTLSESESNALEAAIWNSDYLLSEVVSCHRFQLKLADHNAATSSGKRDFDEESFVSQMTNVVFDNVAMDASSCIQELIQIRTEQTDKAPAVIQSEADSLKILERAMRSQVNTWKLVAGVSTLVASIAVVFAIATISNKQQPSSTQAADSTPPTSRRSSESDQQKAGSDPVLEDPSKQTTDSVNSAEQLPPQEIERPREKNPDEETNLARKEKFEPRETKMREEEASKSIRLAVKPKTTREPIQLNWNEPIRGVVASRKYDPKIQGPWKGILSEDNEGSIEFVTLGDSWASAEVEGLGRLILPAHSNIRIYRDTENDVLRLHLVQGQVAISRMPKGAKIQVCKSFNFGIDFESMKPGSTLVAERGKMSIRTIALAGALRGTSNSYLAQTYRPQSSSMQYPNEIELRPMYCQEWAPNAKLTKLAAAEKPRWIRQPKRKLDLPKTVSHQLLISDQLVDSLATIDQKFDSFRTSGSLTLGTERLWELLNSLNPEERQAASNWIFSLTPNTERINWVSRQLETAGVDKRTLMAMRFSLFKSDFLAYESAIRLATNLNHPVLGERQLNWSIMSRVLSDPTGKIEYSVDSPPEKREIAVQQWVRQIDILSRTSGSPVTPKSKPTTNSKSRDKSFNDN